MTALTGGWMLVTERYQHTWTKGQNYEVREVGDYVIVTSNVGSEKILKRDCDPQLFQTVFGLTFSAETTPHKHHYFKDWRMRA